jgi:2-polyprenyl-3-methyl-5-hydroxy-6-metoxy-1,4-benzoquinol methylase
VLIMTGYAYDDWDRDDVLPFIPAGARTVFDVGCSFGGFGASLKRARPTTEVWGLEPHEDAAAVAATRLDRVIHGVFPDDAPEREFDCVVFNDVLEHLLEPWDALREARTMLAAGGVVVASIPNVRHYSVVVPLLLKGRFTYRDSGIMDRTHLRFFTRSTMVELFEATGFRIEQVAPSRLSPRTDGELARVLAVLGRRADEFRAKNYVVVASAVGETPR